MASLTDALAWAKRGFRVFPLVALGKTPAIASFQFHATTNPDVLEAWWRDPISREERDYNIGVLTNDMVVADVDMKGGRDGVTSFAQLEGHYDTLTVATPNGGYHVYFAGPDSKLAVDLLPGVDIRSHNGYVVAPGSYVIDPKTGVAGEYTVVVDKPLAQVPTGLARLLKRPDARREQDTGIDIDTPTAIVQAQRYLEVNAEVATEGAGGDMVTYKVAAKLVRDYALSIETAYDLMLNHWNDRCQPHGWPPDMLWRKIENADEYATGQTGAALAEEVFATVSVPENTHGIKREGLYFGNALDAQDIEPRPWLVERLLMHRAITTIGATGGAGKSLTILIIAAHSAVGKDLGDYKFTKPGKSIIYNAEDDVMEQSRRLSAICTVYKLDYNLVRSQIMLIDNDTMPLFLASSARGDPAANEPHIAYLIDLCKDPGVCILALDPMLETHGCDENNPIHMQFVMSIYRRIAREGDVSLILSHHTNKASDKARPGDVTGLRGSSAIQAASRVVMMLEFPSKEDREIFSIRDKERYDFVRMDDGKQNHAKRGWQGIWFRWQTVRLASGDLVGVLEPTDLKAHTDAERGTIGLIIMNELLGHSSASCSLSDAVVMLRRGDPLYDHMSDSDLRRRVQRALSDPILFDEGELKMEKKEQSNGTFTYTVVLY